MAHLDMHRMCFLTILLSTPVALKNSFRSQGLEGSRLQHTRREGGGSKIEGEKECSQRGIAQAHTHAHNANYSPWALTCSPPQESWKRKVMEP